ncbi:MAG: site-specific DNA-methyltransferase [Alphaproteobacteria bacterium]|nr:site-specific DNA-methyltransferase [Alphaproteobacteria bacterium]
MAKQNLKIEQLQPEKLTPYIGNARTHTPEQIGQIAGSIAEFGFVNPILIGEDDVIIAGHGRLLAAQKLGLESVPVIRLDHLSKAQRQALVLADNKIAENAGWDEDLLRLELQALEEANFDLDVIGFSETELDDLFAGLDDEDNTEGENEVPEIPTEPISKLGDVWICGNHRVLCGSATELTDVEKVMDGGLADMTFTDPPYNVNYANSAKDKMRGTNRPIKNDNLGEEFQAFLHDACSNMLKVSKGALYICMSSSELHTLHSAFTQAGGRWSTFVIWAKNHFTMGRADYQRQYEPMLYGWKDGNDHFWCGARNQGDVWFINRPVANKLHPTMKPVELVERAILNSSKTKDVVLDSFGGSGTTMIACEKTNRHARLIELDPKYVDVIVQRWQEFTGEEAILLATGEAFTKKQGKAHAN